MLSSATSGATAIFDRGNRQTGRRPPSTACHCRQSAPSATRARLRPRQRIASPGPRVGVKWSIGRPLGASRDRRRACRRVAGTHLHRALDHRHFELRGRFTADVEDRSGHAHGAGRGFDDERPVLVLAHDEVGSPVASCTRRSVRLFSMRRLVRALSSTRLPSASVSDRRCAAGVSTLSICVPGRAIQKTMATEAAAANAVPATHGRLQRWRVGWGAFSVAASRRRWRRAPAGSRQDRRRTGSNRKGAHGGSGFRPARRRGRRGPETVRLPPSSRAAQRDACSSAAEVERGRKDFMTGPPGWRRAPHRRRRTRFRGAAPPAATGGLAHVVSRPC